MPTSSIRTDGDIEIVFDRDDIPITMGWSYALDFGWRGADSNGHEHYYRDGLPTLNHVIDEQHWCDGTEGFEPHEGHWHVDRSHYECKECGVVVEPGTVPPGFTQYIPGVMHAEITGTRSDGVWVRAWLNQEQIEQIRSGDPAVDVLAALGDEQIIESRLSS